MCDDFTPTHNHPNFHFLKCVGEMGVLSVVMKPDDNSDLEHKESTSFHYTNHYQSNHSIFWKTVNLIQIILYHHENHGLQLTFNNGGGYDLIYRIGFLPKLHCREGRQ